MKDRVQQQLHLHRRIFSLLILIVFGFFIAFFSARVTAKTLVSSNPLPFQYFAQLPLPTVRPAVKPLVSLSFDKKNYFNLLVRNAASVEYQLEYVHETLSGDVTEGIEGEGESVRGIFKAKIFAGTQSSASFIPHDVKSGVITVKGKVRKNVRFTYSATFTVQNGKLVLTSEKFSW